MINRSLRQPKALPTLCFTEMWERFGFYIVQATLVLLISNYFKLPDSTAVLITGIFGALIYIAPVIGGYYADKTLGFKYTILMGLVLQGIGYIFVGMLTQTSMYAGLALVILGNGFLKANIPSFLGEFYKHNDSRRRAGFTIYYMGINAGSFIALVSVGFIQRVWGWDICFYLAAVGMLIGVLTFLFGLRHTKGKGMPRNKKLVFEQTGKFTGITIGLCVIVFAVAFLLLHNPNIGDSILIIVGILTLIYLLYLCFFQYQAEQRKHLLALIILILFAVVFWAMFFQMFSAINLFLERGVDRHLFGTNLPPAAFISLESVFILILGFPLAMLWKFLHRIKRDPNMLIKFILAMLFMAFAMKLLVIAIHHKDSTGLVAPGFIVIFFLFVTAGEMFLSPNLLSAVTELSPPHIVGMMMGVQYMSLGFGSAITGALAQLAAIPKGDLGHAIMDKMYAHAFNIYALISLITAIVIACLTPFIIRFIHAKGKAENIDQIERQE